MLILADDYWASKNALNIGLWFRLRRPISRLLPILSVGVGTAANTFICAVCVLIWIIGAI